MATLAAHPSRSEATKPVRSYASQTGRGLTQTLTRDIKRHFGKLGYAIAALRVFARTRPFHVEIVSETESARVLTLQITVGNGRFYCGGNVVEKTATIYDCRGRSKIRPPGRRGSVAAHADPGMTRLAGRVSRLAMFAPPRLQPIAAAVA